MLGYHVPDPDEAMLISGGRASGGTPFKVVIGRGSFVMPIIRHASFLTLAMQEATVEENCVTQQGIAIRAQAVCAFKVAGDDEAIVNAAQRFLSDERQMPALTGRIFAGHLRSIIGSMTVEQIVRERQTLATEVLDASKEEMAKLGLLVDSFQISEFDDMGAGYIQAMAAPHNAAIKKEAAVAQARADQEAAQAQQESQREQAEYARQTAVVKAEYQADVDKASAKASQAGPLAQAESEQQVTVQATQLAGKKATLREQELLSDVVKPAMADAEKVKIAAMAEAEAMVAKSKAAASEGRIALDRLLLESLPEIVGRASDGLASATILLDGTEGFANLFAGMVAQGTAVFDAARSMRTTPNGDSPHLATAGSRGD